MRAQEHQAQWAKVWPDFEKFFGLGELWPVFGEE